jgi:hypothetical protein
MKTMKVDKNEAPEGYEAREYPPWGCLLCAFHSFGGCILQPITCGMESRKDRCHVYFVKKESEKTMEDQYETLTADSAENCKTIVGWLFSGTVDFFAPGISDVWKESAGKSLVIGWEYRRKKPAPKKTKKLVDRTREEFLQLVGRYWAKNKRVGERYIIQSDNWFHTIKPQEHWQIAPLWTEEWEPMQKEIEVEG